MGKKVFMTNLYHYGGIGHYVMDYGKLMREGFSGLIKEVKEALKDCDDDKKDFYESLLIELEAAKTYIHRYGKLAEERSEEEKDEKRKKELKEISSNCEVIAEKGAESYWQALQLWHFATCITEIESNGHSVSFRENGSMVVSVL